MWGQKPRIICIQQRHSPFSILIFWNLKSRIEEQNEPWMFLLTIVAINSLSLIDRYCTCSNVKHLTFSLKNVASVLSNRSYQNYNLKGNAVKSLWNTNYFCHHNFLLHITPFLYFVFYIQGRQVKVKIYGSLIKTSALVIVI